jgi:hypothetical protein
MPVTPLEFYETPYAFTRYLITELAALGHPIRGSVLEPSVGSGAIVRVVSELCGVQRWITNDLDPRWNADYHLDATQPALWELATSDNMGVTWTVGNTPWTLAVPIAEHALQHSTVGVALHLRASIHEVTKKGARRRWMAEHTPSGILWLPRFSYQRSVETGDWATDSGCACWVIWLKTTPLQFIRYSPESLIEELKAETPEYRRRMDTLMEEMRV